jgi:hypothetical protein
MKACWRPAAAQRACFLPKTVPPSCHLIYIDRLQAPVPCKARVRATRRRCHHGIAAISEKYEIQTRHPRMLDFLDGSFSSAGVHSAQQWQGRVSVDVWPAAGDGARCLGSCTTSTWCLHLQRPWRLPSAVCCHTVFTPVYCSTRCQWVALYVLPQVDMVERDERLQAVGCLAQGRQVLAAA